MPRIGITGHMNLTPETEQLVAAAINHQLANHRADNLIGVSCIAAGADTIFAQAVLDLGGTLEVILPAADYRDRKVSAEHRPRFDELMRRAAKVTVLPLPESNRTAYEAANEAMLSSCDQLIAVWDGQTPADKGGTAEVVRSAGETHDMPVKVIWPEGATRA